MNPIIVYRFLAALISIVSKCSLRTEVCHKNQPYNTKLVLYTLILSLYNHFKQLYISNKTEHFSYKGGFGMCLSRHLKELAWALDEWFQFINNFKHVIATTIRYYRG